MRITFVAMGSENISLEYVSAVLKKHGHQVSLAFDRALFNDKAYFPIPSLAKLFNYKSRLIKEIIDSKPDAIGFSVFADNYQWALEISTEIKKTLNILIIFGGIHPTTVPERVIDQEVVDIICLGEGEYPLLELANCIDKGEINYSIKNLWFKKNGTIIKNAIRPLIDNLDDLPFPDKSLFEKIIPIRDYYLTVTSKGCIATCGYCSQNFLQNWEKGKGKFLREKSVDKVIEELKYMKKRYNYKRVDIKNNVLSGSKNWTLEFAVKYKKEIGVPFRIMGHPRTIVPGTVKALKEAGLWHVQIGIESLNPRIRREFLLRYETNEEIMDALKAMDDAGVNYSVDYMVGLPGETEDDLIQALKLFAKCKNLVRASIFWLEYLPGVEITNIARRLGIINEFDIDKIEEGQQENYLSTGSVKKGKQMINLKNYHLIFRMLPITPEPVINFILDHKLQKLFRYFPQTIILILVDVLVSFVVKDHYAIFAMKSYFWEIRRRFIKSLFFLTKYFA